MHSTSYDLMGYFIKSYVSKGSNILDVGGSIIKGDKLSYDNLVTENESNYKSLDWFDADYIVKDYDWSSVPTNTFDVVISGQTLEHDMYFWLTLGNIKNVVKPGGLVIIIVPSKGGYHRFPVDCYRFYPDSALVFSRLLGAEIVEVVWNSSTSTMKEYTPTNLVGVSIPIKFTTQFDSNWGDLGMVFKMPI